MGVDVGDDDIMWVLFSFFEGLWKRNFQFLPFVFMVVLGGIG
jgi:hypothetical protein